MMQGHSTAYEIIWLLRRLFRALAQSADQYLEEFGISAAERAVLEFLYPELQLSVPEIAGRYAVSRQHVQVTVNPLLERGLVTTRPNPRHKRSPLIELTPPGRELFGNVRRHEAGIVEALFAGIPAAEIEMTAGTLRSLLHKLS